MQFKSVLAVLLLTAGSAVASPPACLLAAINTQENPADTKTICGKASDVQKTIQSVCPSGDQSAALSAFAETCKAAGITVPTPSATSGTDISPTEFSEPNQQPISPQLPPPNDDSIAISELVSSTTKKSSSATSTNLLNSGSKSSGAASGTGTTGAGASASSKPNAGTQLTGFGLSGVLGVAVVGFVGGTALIL